MAKTIRQYLKSANATGDVQQRRTQLQAAESSAKRASEWCKVANAYSALLADDASARRCLEAGRAVAQDVRELFQVATAFAEARDPDLARALLIEAEQQVIAGSGLAAIKQWRRLSRTYLRSLDDTEEARRCLDLALDKSDDLPSCFEVAKAWRDWGGKPERIAACFQKASDFTETIRDLLDTAEMFRKLGLDRSRVRDCLDAAYRLSRCELSEIEVGYREWLDDSETADRIALPHVSPQAFVNRCRAMEAWSSDAGGLFTYLSQYIDRSGLQAIADADYGDPGGKYLAVLSRIADSGLLPDPFPWQIDSVLELIRWGDGPHVPRAFACTLLCLRDSHPHADWSDAVQQTIAVLLESCLELGSEAMAHLEGLLVAVAEGHPWEDTPTIPFVLLGLLLVAAWRDEFDERLPALANQIVDRERRGQEEFGYAQPDYGWLLGLSAFTLRHDVWRDVARRILGSATEPHLRAIFARLNATS